MKRYDLSAECSKCGSLTKDLTESPVGDWVLYSDVEALLEKMSQDTDRDVQLIKANTREQILA